MVFTHAIQDLANHRTRTTAREPPHLNRLGQQLTTQGPKGLLQSRNWRATTRELPHASYRNEPPHASLASHRVRATAHEPPRASRLLYSFSRCRWQQRKKLQTKGV